jgi:hypothetical protein
MSIQYTDRLLAVLTLAAGVGLQAQTVTLKFDSLPSAQGWTYEHVNNTLAENQVFKIGGAKLHLDTVAANEFQGAGGDNLYRLPQSGTFKVEDSRPFTITVKAIVTGYQLNPANPAFNCGFSFAASTGKESYGVCIMPIPDHNNPVLLPSIVSLFNGTSNVKAVPLDNPKGPHTYRLEVFPGLGAKLFIDANPPLLFGAPVPSAIPNSLELGDGTGGANAIADITYFSYSPCVCR